MLSQSKEEEEAGLDRERSGQGEVMSGLLGAELLHGANENLMALG